MRKLIRTTLITSVAVGVVHCSGGTPESPPAVTISAAGEDPSATAQSSSTAPTSVITTPTTTVAAPKPTPAATPAAPVDTMPEPEEPQGPPALGPGGIGMLGGMGGGAGGTPSTTPETPDPASPTPTTPTTPAPTTSTTTTPAPSSTSPFGGNFGGNFGGGTPTPTTTSTTPTTPTTPTDPAPSSSSGGGPVELDCEAAVPSGGTQHQSNNQSGKAGNLDWTIWSNGNGGSITTYDVPAFSASWNNSGDFLARLGLQWDHSKTYDQYGTITAQFAAKKSGSGGQYSYIGVYGWSVDPCVEWYIVEDSYNNMPVNPGSTSATAMPSMDIDGGQYVMYSRNTSGTGGSKCQGVNNWVQYYSIRKQARDCGTISITQHFDAWKAQGWELGNMDQAQLLIEVGGGQGSIDFTTANITTTQ